VYLTTALSGTHDCTAFDSGRPVLDEWLRAHAATAQTRGLGRTFVWADQRAPSRVVAYYTLAAHVIEQQYLGKKLGRGLPRALPAVLLGRLALDRSLHGQGLGGAVLAEAVRRIAQVSLKLGARFIVVDAIDVDAARCYEHYGFTRVPDQESMRLIQRIGQDFLRPESPRPATGHEEISRQAR
jgi:GNAT superfamily N-acetyltransferase